MRLALVLIGVLSVAVVRDDGEKRFGIELDTSRFPQNTPKDALRSVVKTLRERRFDYLLAHLSDPEYVDERVKKADGKFENVLKETKDKFAADPTAIEELGKFLRDGEWKEEGPHAVVELKDVKNRKVFLKRVDARWFLENRQK